MIAPRAIGHPRSAMAMTGDLWALAAAMLLATLQLTLSSVLTLRQLANLLGRRTDRNFYDFGGLVYLNASDDTASVNRTSAHGKRTSPVFRISALHQLYSQTCSLKYAGGLGRHSLPMQPSDFRQIDGACCEAFTAGG